MKACDICPSERIQIGVTYSQVSALRRMIGVIFIYIPIIFIPFIIVVAWLTHFSLWILGARNLKRYRDFLPEWSSHRYKFKDQVVMDNTGWQIHLGWRIFWFLNCNLYCPLSVALFEYLAYLVKAVESWWCPFYHSKKPSYKNAPIDKSYWHVKPGEEGKLHPDDYNDPVWNGEIVQIGKGEEPQT